MSVRTASIPLPATAAPRRLSGEVYRRRRRTAVLVASLVIVGSVLLARAASVALADRGGVPASAATVRTGEGFTPAVPTYIAQPGDTLWSIAQRFHGGAALDWYVDELVELNGSASIQAGQQIILP